MQAEPVDVTHPFRMDLRLREKQAAFDPGGSAGLFYESRAGRDLALDSPGDTGFCLQQQSGFSCSPCGEEGRKKTDRFTYGSYDFP